jgi:hypothetical protein
VIGLGKAPKKRQVVRGPRGTSERSRWFLRKRLDL